MHKKTAQAIADSTSEVLGYGVLVTDKKGIIIGCSESSRVGNFHAPSLFVIDSGRPNMTSKNDAASLGVRPGYTAPIRLRGMVEGTVSIAGPPHKVERYGRLVQRQAEVLLMEQAFLEMRLRRQWVVKELVESIMLYRPEDDSEEALLLRGRDLGYDLTCCRIAVILDLRPVEAGEDSKTFRDMALNRVVNFFDDRKHLISTISSQQIAAFLSLH